MDAERIAIVAGEFNDAWTRRGLCATCRFGLRPTACALQRLTVNPSGTAYYAKVRRDGGGSRTAA